jgi:hypothetical protein
LAREHTEEAVRTLVELMRHGVPDAVKGAANALLSRGGRLGLPDGERESVATAAPAV